tara:strand:+ start:1510 stop:1893 length:384 start_codon:yes stop_codon:yes gene_type:complete
MKSLLLLLLIGVPAAAQTVTPNFTTGSMTQTTSATQTVTETSVIERFGGTVQTWNGDNVKAIKTNSSGNLVGPVDITGTDTQFHVVDSDLPWQLEIITRDAGLIETESINRTIDTETITNTLSVFSQ